MILVSNSRLGFYQNDDGDGSGEAPDEFIVDGDPTEVRVPVAFRVQPHGQTCIRHTHTERDVQRPGQTGQVRGRQEINLTQT